MRGYLFTVFKIERETKSANVLHELLAPLGRAEDIP
jgi:hypothetical protein